MDPVVTIGKDEIDDIKQSLDQVINRDTAGLSDLMIKKIILAYYRGLYLNDTTILIEITPEDLNVTKEEYKEKFFETKDNPEYLWADGIGMVIGGAVAGALTGGAGTAAGAIIGGVVVDIACGMAGMPTSLQVLKENSLDSYLNEYAPFGIVAGDPNIGMGEEGKLYIWSTGMVKIYAEGTDIDNNNENDSLEYYNESVLDEIYEEHYKNLLVKNPEYAASTLEYLKKCYTYTDTGKIKMYSTRTTETTEKTWRYFAEGETVAEPDNLLEAIFGESEDTERKRKLTPTTVYPVVAQYISFEDLVSEFATPVELLVDLLQITSSKEFVNAFIEKAGGSEYFVELKLNLLSTQEVESFVETKNRTTYITGKRTYECYINRYKGPEKDAAWVNGSGGATVSFKSVKESDQNIFEDGFGNEKKTEIKLELANYKDDGTIYEVKIKVNGIDKETVELKYKDGFWFFDTDNTEKSYVYYYSIGDIETTRGNYRSYIYRWENTSMLEETEIITRDTLQYDIGVTKVKTWYGELNPTPIKTFEYIVENKQEDTDTKEQKWVVISKYILSIEGTKIYIQEQKKDENNEWVNNGGAKTFETSELDGIIDFLLYMNKRSLESENSKEYISPEDETVENIEWDIEDWNTVSSFSSERMHSLEECLKIQFNHTFQCIRGQNRQMKIYQDNTYYSSRAQYIITNSKYTDTGIPEEDGTAVRKQMYIKSVYKEIMLYNLVAENITYDFNNILSLLSQNEASGDYLPVLSGGKEVTYGDVYGGKMTAAAMLENGADMLYELLESVAKEDLAFVFKKMLAEYKNGDYSVTSMDNYVIFRNVFDSDEIDSDYQWISLSEGEQSSSISTGISGSSGGSSSTGISGGKQIITTQQMFK